MVFNENCLQLSWHQYSFMGNSGSSSAHSSTDDRVSAEDLAVRVLLFHGDVPPHETLPGPEWVAEALSADMPRFVAFKERLLALSAPEEGKALRFRPFLEADQGVLLDTAARGFRFDIKEEQDRDAATAASMFDRRISKVKPLLVTQARLSENEFFRNYFTHVTRLRRWLFATLSASPSENARFRRKTCAGTALIAGEKFRVLYPELSELEIPSLVHLAQFMCLNCHRGPDFSLDMAVLHAKDHKDRTGVMGILKVGSPTFLSLLLEEFGKTPSRKNMPERFWRNFRIRVVGLTSVLETFTDSEKLIPISEVQRSHAHLYAAVNAFKFSWKEDQAALQAAWALDPRLSVPFKELIPHHLSKSIFWTNYLRHVLAAALQEFLECL